ncbi:flagellar biosynthesis chaperone [bacterium BMS3Bbin12]|nr:flagellar biosynthesis chaperone [bacterium BMS3Abin12]GBE47978.1 flagellar biosynthesis chaperone [bacterium BMS3Bbin12]GBE49713.1 flagellar biosynthesis chaperone [bacterium BMS3Bbin13]HDJ86721.1 flagellar export protein FliJ [Chromatiales bacterium]HDK03137.1 flagellar export protein FliJ [Gammaproteobacteria bacterium]
MTRSKRMQPIARLAAEHERDAARELAASRRELEAHRGRLRELCGYRDEYARRFREAGVQGIDAAQLRDYRSFLTRLHEAIAEQDRLVMAAQRDWEAYTARWQGTRIRTKALDKVVERLRHDEDRREHRREQGESDEHAQRRRSDLKES